LRIRTALPADVPALHALVERAYRGKDAKAGWTHEADLLGGQRSDIAMLSQMIADPDQRILIASDGKGPIGCAAIAQKKNGLSYLGLVTVDPLRQAGGIGRALIAAAEAFAQTVFSTDRMEMTVIAQRSELIAWYQRCGYRLTGETREFPYGDAQFGLPNRRDLYFVVLEHSLASR
jgi:GNAT superfamily N-acetyltransferase